MAVTGGRVLRLDEARGQLVEDPALAGMRGKLGFVAEDAAGNVWMDIHPPAVALRQGTGWTAAARSLVEMPGHGVLTIFTEPDGVVWLGGAPRALRWSYSPPSIAAMAQLSGSSSRFGGQGAA